MSARVASVIPFRIAAAKLDVVTERLEAHPYISSVTLQSCQARPRDGVLYLNAHLAQEPTPEVLRWVKDVFSKLHGDNSNELYCSALRLG